MTNGLHKILGDYNSFLDIIFLNLKNDKINITNLELDHICYRVNTLEKYYFLKIELLNYGKLLVEQIISGRYISTFKLTEPIIYRGRKIYILELPSPKTGSHYLSGFEHVEFVIDLDFKAFMNKYKYLNFITKDIDKVNNPDIKLKYKDCAVKFHENSLENIITNTK